ncbi:MAG: hypothetical protein F6K39_08400 [Okeania sp. SIO3B3]|nr:hypothetical protein [Okeania sp. SIO3B3]
MNRTSMFDRKRLKLLSVNALRFDRQSNNYCPIDRTSIIAIAKEMLLGSANANQQSNNYCPIDRTSIIAIAKESDIAAEWILRTLLSCNKALIL